MSKKGEQQMRFKTKWVSWALVLGFTLWLTAPEHLLGQTAKEEAPITTNHNASPPKDEVVSSKTKKIDNAGETLGKGVERFGEKASSQVGGWIKC